VATGVSTGDLVGARITLPSLVTMQSFSGGCLCLGWMLLPYIVIYYHIWRVQAQAGQRTRQILPPNTVSVGDLSQTLLLTHIITICKVYSNAHRFRAI